MAKKGTLVYKLTDNYTVVDLETTGLDSRWDSIIEVAALRVRGGLVVDSYESLIHNPYGLPEFITELTGITSEMVKMAPPEEKVIPAFLDFVGDDLLLGHCLCFDVRFINRSAQRVGKEEKTYQYMDTMYMGRKVFPEWKHHRLDDLVENLEVPAGIAHRALGDAYRTKGCYDALRVQMQMKEMTEADLQPKTFYKPSAGLQVQEELYEPDIDIADKTFAFTGALERMTRQEAMQTVLNAGGRIGDGVTKATDYLVIGNAGYCKELAEGKSGKRKKAEKMKLQGHPIEVISEDVFLEMLEPND